MTDSTDNAPERIAFRKAYMSHAITSGPLMDHPDYVQYIRADLAPDPQDARAWHPIDTAPKDELIDIWLSDGVRWCDCYHDRICDEWRTSRPSGRLLSIKAKHVTHWMPRPAPPALAAFDKGGKDE